MFVTRKHISRRTILRGMGASLALPLLDSMVPAQTPLRQTAASPRTRLACIEMVHGAAGSTEEGDLKHYWVPRRKAPISISRILWNRWRRFATTSPSSAGPTLGRPDAFAPAEGGADHFRSSAVYLTAAHSKHD